MNYITAYSTLLLFAIFSFESLIFIEARRSRNHNLKVERSNGMVIVRQRSLEEPISQTNSTESLPKNISYDEIYSEWSKWSKCRKRCKQVRTRICKSPEFCHSTILKEERNCTGNRCQINLDKDKNQEITTQHNHNGDNHRGRGRSTQFRVLYHLQSYVYSQWSEWSSCTKTCHTRRYRACEMKQICGNSIIQEDALCYTQGSYCEKLYKSKAEEVNEEEANLQTQLNIKKQINNTNLINDENCGISSYLNDPTRLLRIIGGREANKGRWPWMVAILNRYHEPFCGGTLVTPQFIITAAHCVRRRLYVRAGEHDLMFSEGSEQQIRVTDIFVHPEYDAETVDNDIALLKIRTPLKINRFVSPICLPTPEDVMPVNGLGTILGWGKRRNSAVFGTDVLHQAQVPIADIDDCKNVYENYFISENMVCAGYKKGKVDSCAGDSGGPLLFNKKTDDNTDQWYLYGITSFGEGCGKKGRYGIYAKVPNLVNWIRKTIQSNTG